MLDTLTPPNRNILLIQSFCTDLRAITGRAFWNLSTSCCVGKLKVTKYVQKSTVVIHAPSRHSKRNLICGKVFNQALPGVVPPAVCCFSYIVNMSRSVGRDQKGAKGGQKGGKDFKSKRGIDMSELVNFRYERPVAVQSTPHRSGGRKSYNRDSTHHVSKAQFVQAK